MKKLFLKTMMLAAALVLGVGQSWAQETTTLYERGTAKNPWSDADLTDWVLDGTAESSITANGLKFAKTEKGRTEYTYTKSITTSDDAIVSANIVWTPTTAYGSSTAGAYITIGDTKLFWCGQDRNLTITIGSAEAVSLISSGSTSLRGTTFNVNLTINKASKAVSYSISNSSYNSGTAIEGAGTSATGEVSSIIFGWARGGQQNTSDQIVNSISVTEEVQEVLKGSYTINYLCGETVIQEATVSEGVVGDNVVVSHNPIWFEANKYMYVSDNTETTPITAEGIIINVQYRLANTYSYTFSSNVGTWSATGTAVEGETAKAYVPRYIVVGSTAYILGGISWSANNFEYSKSATIESDGQEITVNYNEFANNIVYFNEGEDIYSTEYTGAPTRTSMGTAGAIENETVVTTLAPGKYKLYCASHCGNSSAGATVTYLVGGNTILTQSPKGWLALEYNGVEFTVNTSSDLIITQEGNAAGLDYVLIEKTGDVVAVTDLGWASYCSPSNLTIPADVEAYYASKVGSESVTLTALKEGDVVPAGFGMLIKAAEGNYTFNIAATSTVSVDNQLSGTLVETATADLKKADTDKIYVLGNVDGAKLCNFTGDNVPANKAYLRVAKAVNSAPMRFVFEDEATGISQTMTDVKMSNGQCYNLQGQKVATDYNGIVIMNGKKVVMK